MKKISIVDVDDFLKRITEQYLHLGRKAHTLAIEIPRLRPEVIQHRCIQLNNERQGLTQLDKQLTAILQLAGEDLLYSTSLTRYRQAFSTAVKSFDTIHGQLLSLRQRFLQETRH